MSEIHKRFFVVLPSGDFSDSSFETAKEAREAATKTEQESMELWGESLGPCGIDEADCVSIGNGEFARYVPPLEVSRIWRADGSDSRNILFRAELNDFTGPAYCLSYRKGGGWEFSGSGSAYAFERKNMATLLSRESPALLRMDAQEPLEQARKKLLASEEAEKLMAEVRAAEQDAPAKTPAPLETQQRPARKSRL